MNKPVKNETLIVITNGLLRLTGNIVKVLSYPFHFIFPKKRFTIPEFSPAKAHPQNSQKINRTIWQTNYSNRVTLPIYCNYLVNRLLSRDYDYRYVSTEAREEYIKTHADERTFNAYSKLTDGAAQADFWRIFTLYNEGGIYMDIDGHLVWNLDNIIHENDSEVLITRRQLYTNFFMASEKGNIFLKDTLDIIINNIEQRKIEGGVFSLTGPTCLNQALEGKTVNTRRDKITCAQGTFSNEYFQYMDKKMGKWNHAKNENLLK
ncbi:glycosyl transferase [Lonepinella koalarum]|uniref:Mannosyltransferase OCH1-like enzyme n=1 Tax=Lonepinella koalarum TaxID=53417 RepID=A0A4R1KZA9_9PAST|nr:glycosyltransferase [Lonepinella koalarum]MDH2927745.1 glycosyl transferase [Lonepinella koalarum]TCK69940.1 mannosyltransferase OCH1-like enzyme [Lonepinella koalarum]TFJ90457.1 glycosyl transferase [Lonepinella koalarum]TYG35153.1 glycosyl transferase [Lonepinella koalarum]